VAQKNILIVFSYLYESVFVGTLVQKFSS